VSKEVLFVHGGAVYEEDRKLAASLRDALGAAYEVRYPEMPDEDAPEYGAWRDCIAEELTALGSGVILVGHSLGASVLFKYLSEEDSKAPVGGLFLVAAPFWGAEDWEVDEYTPREDFAAWLPERLPIFFYHGRDDEIVPFEHLSLYAEKLPWATFRELDGGGHQLGNDLSGVARDIARLEGEMS